MTTELIIKIVTVLFLIFMYRVDSHLSQLEDMKIAQQDTVLMLQYVLDELEKN